MNQNDIDLEWSGLVAGLVVDEFIIEKFVKEADRAAAQQIHVLLSSGSRSDASSRRYLPGGTGFKP